MAKDNVEIPGITFTGPITVNGPMFDIHDNEHVHIHTNGGVSDNSTENGVTRARNSGRPKRTGKTITKSFIYDIGSETNLRLQMLYNGLLSLNWVKENTELKPFLSLFSGKETTYRAVWTGEVNALTELFKELVTRKKLVQLPKGESIWVMVNARFWDKEGNKEFGNDKLRSTRAPLEMKSTIDTLVRVMNPNISIETLRKEIQSQH